MTFYQDARKITRMAWPVFIGQIAVIAFGIVDTAMLARYSTDDVAAFAVGGALYLTLFVGLMGILNATGPIVGQLFGAKRYEDAGHALKQSLWLAVLLSALGCIVLLIPRPWIAIAHAGPEFADRIASFLAWLALALPAALSFAAIRSFNTAISRPKAVMVIQLMGLALKVPLNSIFIFGWHVGGFEIEARGSSGCALATACAMWCNLLAGVSLLAFDGFYSRFAVFRGGFGRPEWAVLKPLLRLGVPMGLSYLVEVSAFTFMAVFIARLGSEAVAGHQIVANLVSAMFMLQLSLAVATSTLVAQRVGAGRLDDARSMGWHGVRLAFSLSALTAATVWIARDLILRAYTHDAQIAAAALLLLGFGVVFHLADGLQTMCAFVLRSYKIAVVPTVVYALSLWGIGIGGGYWLAFGASRPTFAWIEGARAFWFASVVGYGLAAIGMLTLLLFATRSMQRSEQSSRPA